MCSSSAHQAEEVALAADVRCLSPACTGLLCDWGGGSLTTNLFASFQDPSCGAELDPETLRERFSGDEPARDLLIALEKGEHGEEGRLRAPTRTRFSAWKADWLIDRLFAGAAA